MLSVRLLIAATLLSGIAAMAQSDGVTPNDAAPATVAPGAGSAPVEDKRIFGVLPNNRTAEASTPFEPITAGHKLTIAAKDSFDWPVYLTAAGFAGLYQIENQNPSFGQGVKGYARRLGTSYADQTIGNMMTEGIMPSVLHEDPRYFRLGEGKGSGWYRTWYALSRIMVTKTDSGKTRFNFSEWVGNAGAVALSNAWYPDTRTATDNLEKLAIQCATDAFSNVLKEFWPDVKRRLHKKHESEASAGATAFR